MLACHLHPLPYASPHRPSRRMRPLRSSQTEVAESLHLLKFPEAATEASSGVGGRTALSANRRVRCVDG